MPAVSSYSAFDKYDKSIDSADGDGCAVLFSENREGHSMWRVQVEAANLKKNRGDKMNGWLYGRKAIADYIGCDVKTLLKYASEYSLPIRRLPNGKPFAIPSEMDRWGKDLKKP